MISILFVCTGNICRSPMAEGILAKKLKENHIEATVDSCGFESFHVGDPPDRRAIQVSSRYGVNIAGHRARLFTMRDFDQFDLIYVMDSGHYRNVIKKAGSQADRDKVDYLLNQLHPGMNQEVIDPWYHDIEAFEMVFKQMDQACDKLILHLKNGFIHGR